MRRMIVFLLAALLPIGGFYILLDEMPREPVWSWLMAFVPGIYCGLWLILGDRRFVSANFALRLTLIHATAMLAALVVVWWPHVAVTALFYDALLALSLHGRVRQKSNSIKRFNFSTATIFWASSICYIFTPLGLFNSIIVASRAEWLAGERPYCIQYSNFACRYDPVRSILDLSVFKLLNRCAGGFGGMTYFSNHHGLLTLDDGGRRYYNWSYEFEGFREEVVNREFFDKDPFLRPEIVCRPEPHFAMKLPLWL